MYVHNFTICYSLAAAVGTRIDLFSDTRTGFFMLRANSSSDWNRTGLIVNLLHLLNNAAGN